MAKKKNISCAEYGELVDDLKAGRTKRLYYFCGEERYLLEHYLGELRKQIPKGTEEFNHRRFEGKSLTVRELSEAVDALPVFSERTLTEVGDFDFVRASEEMRSEMADVLSDIPEYACVVFVSGGDEFRLDARQKVNARLKKLFTTVVFQPQEQDELEKWIARHVRAAGKRIDRRTAEYLSFVTGGLMTSLDNEIEKLSSYCRGDEVTREDVDAVVTPVLDAAAYQLTDAVLRGAYGRAVGKLGELRAMDEPPHRILFSVSSKARQLLGAKICLESGAGAGELMNICGIKHDFQARDLMSAARRMTMDQCRAMTRLCAETAYRLNSSQGDGFELLSELVVRFAAVSGKAG